MSLANPLEFRLIPFKAETILTAQVNGTLTSPYMTIPYDNDVVVSNPIAGNTVWFGSTPGARDYGVLRLRSWNGSNQISVAENDDVTPYVPNNAYITIKSEWRLWPIYPRVVQSGTEVTFYIDYDIAWSGQTKLWRPVAVAGPPSVSDYNGATFQAKFVGDRSFALAQNATLTGFLWTAVGSVEGTSASQGTEASPVVFTWTSPGQKLVYLRVTDSNGNTHTNYTWAFGVDPNNIGTTAYTNFDSFNDNFDFEQGGGSSQFTVHGDATITDFPDECMVILATRGDLTTPTAYWPYRSNVHFVGYVIGSSVRQNPLDGDVTFRAATVDSLMRNLTAFPVSLTDRRRPQDWTMALNLNTDRAASYLWHYHSTLSLMTSIIPSNYTPLIQRQDFGPGDLYNQLQGELIQSILGRVVSSHQSVLYHTINYQMMLDSERNQVTTGKTLHKGIWVDDVIIEQRNNYDWPTNQVKMSGVYYPGNEVDDVCPSFSEAPGDAPKVYGKEVNFDRLIISGQNDLNVRCGRALAMETLDIPALNLRFINDGSFMTVPQTIFPTNIEANDNDRGITFTDAVIPRRISRNYDHELGYITLDITFEPVADGPPGITVDLPCGPPEQVQPNSWTPPSPTSTIGPQSLASTNLGASFYFATQLGQNWQRRVNGLDESQLNFSDMIPDPWSTFKNGYNINQIILWGCGASFLVRSGDTGQNWEDRLPYMDNPPNSWGDGTTPQITGTTVKQVVGDLFRQNTFYHLLQSYNSGYRGWITRTSDDGFTFSYYALTGTSEAYPLRMDVDKQDGTILWVTLWESDLAIRLRKYNITSAGLTLAGNTTLMTGTSITDVLTNTYTAFPFAPLGDKNLLYVYGRLTNPMGLSGTVQIMRTIDGASNFNATIDNWDSNYCGSLFVDEDNGDGNRGVYAVRQGQ